MEEKGSGKEKEEGRLVDGGRGEQICGKENEKTGRR
jgi:hypothetical protein